MYKPKLVFLIISGHFPVVTCILARIGSTQRLLVSSHTEIMVLFGDYSPLVLPLVDVV